MQNLINKVRSQISDLKGSVFALASQDEEEGTIPDELQSIVIDAVSDYSRWNPVQNRRGRIDVIVGQTDYDLPADFMGMEVEPSLNFLLSEKVLILKESPKKAGSFSFFYRGMRSPESVPEYDVPAVVWLASANALRAVLADQERLQRYINYKIPNASEIDAHPASRVIEQINKAAQDLERQYNKRMENYQRAQLEVASRGPYMTFG
ncbi:hypothetical protein CIG75_12785 [Tumebacillus algifaecis]|uniref:Uncharacterized protein n=1 Tax=Tumebacillus algifaecis TaxID=1214604 RepID=A0A223D2Q8_9BACL|nr:hypothetical protein [Tumebacillus algifaecis]ASS75775.1 hypothetical protein CIG75_12785 [Tumebacillus algifaecis]